MAASAVLSQQRNGFSPHDVAMANALEYEKILQLRDEVFAGTHPRLKISADKPGNLHSSNGIAPPYKTFHNRDLAYDSNNLQDPKINTLSGKLVNDRLDPSLTSLPNRSVNDRQTTTTSTTNRGSSGIDPIFLTKSSVVLEAEAHLKRQRIERSLEDQVQLKKITDRRRAIEHEALPDFDVNEVLFQAQELVKPAAAAESSTANVLASSSDSFDDNTFYSTPINESTPNETEEYNPKKGTKPCRFFFDSTCRKGDACTYSHDPAFKQQLEGVGSQGATLTMRDSVDGEKDSKSRTRKPEKYNANGARIRRPSDGGRTQDFERESLQGREQGREQSHQQNGQGRSYNALAEEAVDLSPPHSLHLINYGHRHQQHDLQPERNYSRQGIDSPGYSPSDPLARRTGRASPAQRDVRIVRNHITSPIAPQPARVSPLAVAKMPRVDQVRRDHEAYSPGAQRLPASAQQSPSTMQPPKSKKRRREPDGSEGTRNVVARRYLDSPGPYIKDEPVSPPAFADVPTYRYQRHEEDDRHPLAAGPPSPQNRERIIYQPVHVDQPYVERPDLHRVSTPIVRRVVSQTGQHYEVQDEPDLRRIVSARQPRRVYSPQQDLGHYSAPQSRSARAMSHSYIVQPEFDRSQQYRASVQPQPPIATRPPSPEIRRVQYAPVERDTIMAPPPRRIVVDQYGNQYYEAAAAPERRVPMAAAPHYSNDGANPFKQPYTRRASVHPEPSQTYNDGAYIHRGVSPGAPSPRFVEYYPHVEPIRAASRQPLYEERDPYPDRNDAVRIVEYPQERLVSRYEEAPRPRESVMRMQSVRPVAAHYDSRDQVTRVHTVQPEERVVEVGGRGPAYVRQISVRPDERYGRPEYVEARPRYEYVSNGRGGGAREFVDGDMDREVLMEAPRSAGRRPFK